MKPIICFVACDAGVRAHQSREIGMCLRLWVLLLQVWRVF